jgi:hypothetical protein
MAGDASLPIVLGARSAVFATVFSPNPREVRERFPAAGSAAE